MYIFTDTYSKKEYDGDYSVPWINQLNQFLGNLLKFSMKYPNTKKLCDIISIIIGRLSWYLEIFWRKKNHLVDSSDKYTYKILSPAIKAGLNDMYKQDLIYYICLLEKYGKKELDTWGFEPPKKVGKLKRLWYDLTLTVY